jgi:glutaminase
MLDNDVEEVLDLYCRHCSVLVTTADLARLGANLAHSGESGMFGKPDTGRHVLSVMMTCGMYNDAGQWAFEVGYPAKSGVSGGMAAAVPGKLGVGVFSPPVNDLGSSVRGMAANRLLSQKLGLHLFACKE